jgi:transcriptional regulator with XRE-family HTH domain
MERLRRAREAVNFTRARLARESGVPPWKIAQAELEGYQLSAGEVESLLRVLRPEVVKLVHSLLEFQAVEQ